VLKIVTSVTIPVRSLTVTQSPTRNGRAINNIKPPITAANVERAAKAMTAVIAPAPMKIRPRSTPQSASAIALASAMAPTSMM
jgi:hypothetical protein